jgi:hypothetical protein
MYFCILGNIGKTPLIGLDLNHINYSLISKERLQK